MPPTEILKAVEAVWRIESPRLIGGLTRLVRDISIAEELAQDAMLAALKQWSDSGIPTNPGAWLTAAAKNRAIDLLRRDKRIERSHEEIARHAGFQETPDYDTALDDPVGDNLLRLMFTSCHPVLSPESRAALTLRLLGGLTTDEIARAFLLPEPTIAQRIVRAKRALAKAGVPFELPRREHLPERLESVLEVLYLIFNEGYSATAGQDWMRPALCEDAMRLGRILGELAPGEPEVHGLVALMELQASRLPARTGPDGRPILLLEQSRGRWDRVLIGRGLAALGRTLSLAHSPGPYTLQAAIAACHAQAPTAAQTDWPRIASLYKALAQATGSPVVELNRAVAIGMAEGPAAGLEIIESLKSEPSLQTYSHLWSARGDLLSKLGRTEEASRDFEQAASLTRNVQEREILLHRIKAR